MTVFLIFKRLKWDLKSRYRPHPVGEKGR